MRTAVQRPAVDAEPPSRGARFRSGYLRRAPGIIATISALLGVLALLGALDSHERFRVHAITRVIPVPASAAATAVGAVAGLLLLRLAAALRKRKRRAWRAAVVIAAIMTVAHVVRGVRVGEAVISLILLVLLITARSRYTAKSDPRSRWFAALVFFQFIGRRDRVRAADALRLPRPARRPPVVLDAAERGADLAGRRRRPSISAASASTTSSTARCSGSGCSRRSSSRCWRCVRPSRSPGSRPQDEERLRELLAKQGGRDSLGYFALRRDKSVVWSPTGKAAITYRVVQGVALASGDPIGDPEAWPGAMAAYRGLVGEYGWTAAVMGCSELGATVYKRECDLSALALGDEAIVEVEDFTLEGRPMRGVRQACTRVCRGGLRGSGAPRPSDRPRRDDKLVRAAAAWRGDAVERGFSMALSRLGDPADSECVVATAYQNGVLAGILHFVPWGDDGLSLDLMRRDRGSDNGLNEYMIAKVIEHAPELGVRRVSLNFAVFRDAIERGERIGAGPILRAWRWVLIFLSRWWQIETLYRFNVKFRPYWEPRFISFPSTRDIPRIAIAALEAEAFIVRPHRLKQLLGRG